MRGGGCRVVVRVFMSPVFTGLCCVGAVEFSCGDEFSGTGFRGVGRNRFAFDEWGM